MRNEGNYLLGLNKSQWPGGDICPGLEEGPLVGGRITPAVAAVVGAQKIVLFNKIVLSWAFLLEFYERVIYERVRVISCYGHKEVE